MKKASSYSIMIFLCGLIAVVSHTLVHSVSAEKNEVLNYSNISLVGWICTVLWYGLVFSVGHLIYYDKNK